MFSTLVVIVLVITTTRVTSAQDLLGLPLDIAGLPSSLGPAPANDARFTNFQPPGSGDGKLMVVRMK